MSNRPVLVGVTGGIGSGKSTICRIFEVLGVPVYYADERARSLMNCDADLKASISHAFGRQAYLADGSLNRAYLAQSVFSNASQLERLNSMVHPAVGRDFDGWVVNNSQFPYLIKEAALVFETKSAESLDRVVLVTAPIELRIERVLRRDPQRSRSQLLDIIDKQLPDAQKERLSDFVLVNDERSLMLPQVLRLDDAFREEARKRAQREA